MLLPSVDDMSGSSGVVREVKPSDGVGEPSSFNGTGKSEAELITKAKNGNKDSFRELVERHQGRLFSLAVHCIGSREDAEDIIQESFVKAWFSLKSFRGDSSITTWLHRIVSNMCIDFRRKRERERSRSIPLDDVDGGELPAFDSVQPDDALSIKSDVSRLSGILESLSPEHRQVVLLREIDGMSYEQIASSLGVSKGTVMSRLHYARKKLAQGFEG